VEGTNKAHENGEAMGLVGVRLTDMLGAKFVSIGFAKWCCNNARDRITFLFRLIPFECWLPCGAAMP